MHQDPENRVRAGRPFLVAASAMVVLTVAGLSGCDEAKIEETVVPKGAETLPPQVESPPPEPTDPAAAAEPARPWLMPDGWRELDGERPMRLATLEAADPDGPVEVAVTRFPGTVGGELANLNRWRGQMGVAPITEADLPTVVQRFETPGYAAYWTRIDGAEETMVAVAVYEMAEDRTWFLRATGPASVMDRITPGMIDVARSIAGLEPLGG